MLRGAWTFGCLVLSLLCAWDAYVAAQAEHFSKACFYVLLAQAWASASKGLDKE